MFARSCKHSIEQQQSEPKTDEKRSDAAPPERADDKAASPTTSGRAAASHDPAADTAVVPTFVLPDEQQTAGTNGEQDTAQEGK